MSKSVLKKLRNFFEEDNPFFLSSQDKKIKNASGTHREKPKKDKAVRRRKK